jgi:hypothetical protein
MVRKQKTRQLKGMSEGQFDLSNHFKFLLRPSLTVLFYETQSTLKQIIKHRISKSLNL